MSEPIFNVARRDFLKAGTAAGGIMVASTWFGGSLLAQDKKTEARGSAKCKQVILLFLEGGPSQFETFDLKPGQKTGAPYKAIDTEVPGYAPSEHMPNLAKVAKDVCLIKSMSSREGNHSRAQYLMHTGYIPNPTLKHPSLGSIVSHQLGKPDLDIPNFVKLRGAPFSAGYLGVEHNPFVIQNPGAKIENLDYAQGVDKERMERRMKLVKEMEGDFARTRGEDAVKAHEEMYKKARRLMDSPLKKNFYITDEPEEVKKAYGAGKFAESCIIARRLIESGVACVEVVQGGWDTHDDGFNRCRDLTKAIDQPAAALINDLKKRGLLDHTMVILMGEFGRTPQVTDTEGRGHWPNNFCALLAGGGVKGGQVIGETDERGEKIVKDPVSPQDFFWTLGTAMGWDTAKEFEAGNRPVWLADKTVGKPVKQILGG
jgi:hypothetical protein